MISVEWALLYANRTASQVRDPQALEVVRTLAAEVRRLQPDAEKYRKQLAVRVERELSKNEMVAQFVKTNTCDAATSARCDKAVANLDAAADELTDDFHAALEAAEAARDWKQAHVHGEVPPRGEAPHAHARRDRNQLR